MSSKVTKGITFSHLAVVTALVKMAKLHEGYWQLEVVFANTAGINANINNTMMPAAVVPIARFGLLRVEALNALAVDAALVNPQNPPERPVGLPAFPETVN